jgi:hypothetical protein
LPPIQARWGPTGNERDGGTAISFLVGLRAGRLGGKWTLPPKPGQPGRLDGPARGGRDLNPAERSEAQQEPQLRHAVAAVATLTWPCRGSVSSLCWWGLSRSCCCRCRQVPWPGLTRGDSPRTSRGRRPAQTRSTSTGRPHGATRAPAGRWPSPRGRGAEAARRSVRRGRNCRWCRPPAGR